MDINTLYNGTPSNMLDPSAYVKKAQVVYRAQQQVNQEMVEQQTLLRCPNYLHKDGRIYASRPGEPYFAVTVSPLNPEFATQIEPGIYPVINALLEKNYLPVSSCEGHGGSHSFVRIVFGSDIAAERFISEFGSMDYVTMIKRSTSANVVQYWEDGQAKWRAAREDDTFDRNLEAQDVNLLYKRSYRQVCYIDLCVHLTRPGITKFFERYKIRRDQQINKARRIQDVALRIYSMESYEL